MNLIRGRQSVCRRLFGPVDHDQLRRDLDLKLWEITAQDSRRWNFNFQSETPLPGRFQWEEIPTDCAADFYLESVQMKDAVNSPKPNDGKLKHSEEIAGTDQENCSSISNTPKCPAETTPVRRKRSLSDPRANTRITDYFTKRRRTAETKTTRNPFHSSSSDAAYCKKIKMSMLL
ncbi:cyclin-dependent kinase inhibitor 1Ca [Melanotaenia boesemani]|uniref:cyclin-dependent kinase inhibitor 1Ca n=1 Tax=Melanotaenia boesemani TaxID=1250792 RepID=UPI001C05BDD4|nr:cyclin-dependent kinase inhibitor 1Ca [Melanotaenia boesemani]